MSNGECFADQNFYNEEIEVQWLLGGTKCT